VHKECRERAAAKWRHKSCKHCGESIKYHEDWENVPDYHKDCAWHTTICDICGGSLKIHRDWDNPPTAHRECQSKEDNHPQRLSINQEHVALALIGEEIKIVSLLPDGEYRFLDETENLHNLIHVSLFNSSDLLEQITELEWLVNNPRSTERQFQDFFTLNKDFILNDEYRDAHPHVVLMNDKAKPLVPDFVLEPVDGALCDLLELKLPSTQVFNLKKNRMRYSAAVAEAAAQLRQYARYFEEEKNRRELLERYGLQAYKPKMFVIIGRRSTEVDPLDERSIQTGMTDVYVRTYDDIINRMKWRAEGMLKRNMKL
jgi:hypothetical protein